MKSISLVIIVMALAAIFGGVGLWNVGLLPKLGAYIMSGYGYVLILVHMAMNKRIESMELEARNRNLYK